MALSTVCLYIGQLASLRTNLIPKLMLMTSSPMISIYLWVQMGSHPTHSAWWSHTQIIEIHLKLGSTATEPVTYTLVYYPLLVGLISESHTPPRSALLFLPLEVIVYLKTMQESERKQYFGPWYKRTSIVKEYLLDRAHMAHSPPRGPTSQIPLTYDFGN
jgi:hypothetical protein